MIKLLLINKWQYHNKYNKCPVKANPPHRPQRLYYLGDVTWLAVLVNWVSVHLGVDRAFVKRHHIL